MLDTNIVSELARNPQGVISTRIAEVGPDSICVSIITAALTQLAFAAMAASEPYPTVGASGGVASDADGCTGFGVCDTVWGHDADWTGGANGAGGTGRRCRALCPGNGSGGRRWTGRRHDGRADAARTGPSR